MALFLHNKRSSSIVVWSSQDAHDFCNIASALCEIRPASQHAWILNRDAENQEVLRVAVAILNYLRDHPQAKDSARGIAKWWVGEKKETVEKSLALLLREEFIEKEKHLYKLKLLESRTVRPTRQKAQPRRKK